MSHEIYCLLEKISKVTLSRQTTCGQLVKWLLVMMAIVVHWHCNVLDKNFSVSLLLEFSTYSRFLVCPVCEYAFCKVPLHKLGGKCIPQFTKVLCLDLQSSVCVLRFTSMLHFFFFFLEQWFATLWKSAALLLMVHERKNFKNVKLKN